MEYPRRSASARQRASNVGSQIDGRSVVSKCCKKARIMSPISSEVLFGFYLIYQETITSLGWICVHESSSGLGIHEFRCHKSRELSVPTTLYVEVGPVAVDSVIFGL